MSDMAIEQPPIETTTSEAKCGICGKIALTEEITVGSSVPIPHRVVTGKFMQFLNDEGTEMGPWWAICSSCDRDPLNLPEVQMAYNRLKNSSI